MKVTFPLGTFLLCVAWDVCSLLLQNFLSWGGAVPSLFSLVPVGTKVDKSDSSKSPEGDSHFLPHPVPRHATDPPVSLSLNS